MLGIVNPSVVSMDAVRNKFEKRKEICDRNYCGHTHGKGECPAFGKECNRCGQKNHFEKKWRSSSGPRSTKSESRCDSIRSDRTKRKCSHRCNMHEIEECHDDGMEDLMDQFQSLFTHRNFNKIDGQMSH